jgi:hypothetical protein
MIQDPAGLLQRVPELRPLCEDPGVRRAVERGDPFRLYRALRWARWLGRLRSQRELIDALLRQRRLFALPLKSNPWLGTVNGFGASLLGSAERDEQDGTHIATHYVVALFAIPLLPLGAYVVRRGEGSGAFNRSWAFFARVPMGPLPWLWSRALALGVMALVVLGAARAYQDSRYQEVRLINGLLQPVRVELGGVKMAVPAQGMKVLSQVPIGLQEGRAEPQEGVEVDTIELDVSSGFEVLAWSIAGAAPVFLEADSGEEEGGNSKRWELRGRAGLLTEDAPDLPGLRFMSTVGRDPQAAVALLPAEERKRLVEQARRDDLLHGAVSEALASWAP